MKSLYKVIKSTSVDIEEEVFISNSSKEDSLDDESLDIDELDMPRGNTLENSIKYKLQLEKQAKQLLNNAKISSEVMLNEAKIKSESLIIQSRVEAEEQFVAKVQEG